MPDGKVILDICDVHGQPVGEKVDVFMKNQTLSDAPGFRNLDVSRPVPITGLNIFPNGMYSMEVDGLSYHAVSRFIRIPPNGDGGTVTIMLPVNPKKVLRVEFPPFADGLIPQKAWDLLSQSKNVLNFAGKTGKDLYDALDPIRKAGFLNLVAKANRTRFRTAGDNGPTVLSFIRELVELRGDRFFASVDPGLPSETANSVADELFHPVSELLHTPPPGFQDTGSYKTFDEAGNLQLSFFGNAAGDSRVDMDIDDAQGFGHAIQVVGNIFNGPTNPYNIHQILIATQELDPGYELIVHQSAAAV
jgi:hypothetical protein